jgi:hypothetical protein
MTVGGSWGAHGRMDPPVEQTLGPWPALSLRSLPGAALEIRVAQHGIAGHRVGDLLMQVDTRLVRLKARAQAVEDALRFATLGSIGQVLADRALHVGHEAGCLLRLALLEHEVLLKRDVAELVLTRKGIRSCLKVRI